MALKKNYMKNISATLVIVLLGIITFLSSCQKYEDGPWISFLSPLTRMYGKYYIITYNVNGVDSLNLYKDSLASEFDFHFDEVNSLNSLHIGGKRNDGKTTFIMCGWGLTDKGKTLKIGRSFGISNCIGTGPFGDKKTSEWKILRLTNGDIKMKTNYNGKEYIVELD